ncbi:macrolide export ATP-binding/permease MacB [Escherichia coli]
MSVTERTREIGIRMAAGGASKRCFATVPDRAGTGLPGRWRVGNNTVTVNCFHLAAFLTRLEIGFSPLALLLAFLCSTATGILFGWLPARNAARLDPVDALARE